MASMNVSLSQVPQPPQGRERMREILGEVHRDVMEALVGQPAAAGPANEHSDSSCTADEAT